MEKYKVPRCPLAGRLGHEGPTVWDKPQGTWTSCCHPEPALV